MQNPPPIPSRPEKKRLYEPRRTRRINRRPTRFVGKKSRNSVTVTTIYSALRYREAERRSIRHLILVKFRIIFSPIKNFRRNEIQRVPPRSRISRLKRRRSEFANFNRPVSERGRSSGKIKNAESK